MSRVVRFLLAGLAALATLIALDAVWLTGVAVHLYRATVPNLLRPEPDLVAAAAFYLVYSGGLMELCVRPALRIRSAALAARLGAVLGGTAYATFGLTNLAVMRDWTAALAVIDMVWGSALTAIAAVVAYKVGQWLAPEPDALVQPGDQR